ncbi:hypothetical protein PG985_008162 [Apiospora marii]|uniref:uncharacterized protein n=1 Tax=Apiospora marii TaxID=335849 RepID=UPI00312FBB12
MAVNDLYSRYKRDTRHMLYWLIRASNDLIQSGAAGSANLKLNTDGKPKVADIVRMACLVGRHIQPPDIPCTIFWLFRAIIRDRTIHHRDFLPAHGDDAELDADIQKSNDRHWAFIEELSKALEALGGSSELPQHGNASEHTQKSIQHGLDELVHCANKFSLLSTCDGNTTDSSSDDLGPQAPNKQKRSRKTKKKNKGKQPQKNRLQKHAAVNQIDLEKCRIIEDDIDDIKDNVEYRMAARALAQEWIDLRGSVQGQWCCVVYDGTNSAVAAGVANAAIEMLQRSELVLQLDFPEYAYYHAVMNSLTNRNPEWRRMAVNVAMPDNRDQMAVHKVGVDVKEQLMVHAYEALLEFLDDFRKTRSGKPTKAMLAQIQDWDPFYDLNEASDGERVAWRRLYTINWLYDLVNRYSAPAIPGKEKRRERYAKDGVDWSASGVGNHHRGVPGLNEFAGVITTLAMQKPGSDLHYKIMPSHVFRLQCLVDAFTASRGWVVSFIHGHRTCIPSATFSPRRDLSTFIGTEQARPANGWPQAVQLLKLVLAKERTRFDDPTRCADSLKAIELVQNDFIEQLGDPKDMDSVPASRFRKHHINGLWEFSPFLCGAGLLEGLEIFHVLGVSFWNDLNVPILLMHLHNMLLQAGYIKTPIDLYSKLPGWFFPEMLRTDMPPTSEFHQALLAHLDAKSRKASKQRQSKKQQAKKLQSKKLQSTVPNVVKSAMDFYKMFEAESNPYHRPKTKLSMWRRASWNPDRIHDEEVRHSVLFGVRLAQTEHVVDPSTGETKPQDTPFVSKMLKETSNKPEDLLKASETTREVLAEAAGPAGGELPLYIRDNYEPGAAMLPQLGRQRYSRSPGCPDVEISPRKLLELVSQDLRSDIHGIRPMSGLNLIRLAVHFILLFKKIEESLEKQRNETYIEIYESGKAWNRPKSVMLTSAALCGYDEQCLRTMAKAFESTQHEAKDFQYWNSAGAPTFANQNVSACIIL